LHLPPRRKLDNRILYPMLIFARQQGGAAILPPQEISEFYGITG
jgi:hypothetical protein